MKIVDAQVHIWANATARPATGHRQVDNFTAEDLLKEMDEAGVSGAILHPPRAWAPLSNEFAVEAARRHPTRFGVLGQFSPDQPEAREQIKDWMRLPGMLGLRFPLVRPNEQAWHKDGTLDWLWPACERHGVPVSLLAGRFMAEFRTIVERFPGVKFMIDHCGVIHTAKDEAALANLDLLIDMAKLPNLAVKATGVQNYSSAPYPCRNFHEPLRRIFDAYGPRRMFWGTDLTGSPIPYRQCVTLFTEELPWLKGADLELVMGGAIREWLNWTAAA